MLLILSSFGKMSFAFLYKVSFRKYMHIKYIKSQITQVFNFFNISLFHIYAKYVFMFTLHLGKSIYFYSFLNLIIFKKQES